MRLARLAVLCLRLQDPETPTAVHFKTLEDFKEAEEEG
jgi:hypothetical protein